MARPKHAEVSAVECRKFRFSQALGNREHRRVDEPNVCIDILIAQFAGAAVIVALEVFHTVRARLDVLEQGNRKCRCSRW